MRYLGYEVCLLACRIAGVPDRQCNAFHRAQTCQPEGDSRSGFLPAGLPSFPVPRRAHRLLVFSFDYSACGQPIASSDLAAYCSASSARAEFLQRVRRLLTGGSLRPGARARRQPPRITIPRRGFATAPHKPRKRRNSPLLWSPSGDTHTSGSAAPTYPPQSAR